MPKPDITPQVSATHPNCPPLRLLDFASDMTNPAQIEQVTRTIYVKLEKKHTSYLYHTLEANEGLCFYSTLNDEISHYSKSLSPSKPQIYKVVEVSFSPTLSSQLKKVLQNFYSIIPFEDVTKEYLFKIHKTLYGPVQSWRYGWSLGIDPIFFQSTCSFNCTYCQLGSIIDISHDIKEYISTSKIKEDLVTYLYEESLKPSTLSIDCITYSGSGEPTLASNLKEIIVCIKELLPDAKQHILTNGTTLDSSKVREALHLLDRVNIKLDTVDEKDFIKINRPHASLSLSKIIKSIIDFGKEYQGILEIQTMIIPYQFEKWKKNPHFIKTFCEIINLIEPQYLYLNTPTRVYPHQFHRENRGNHIFWHDHTYSHLKTISIEDKQWLRSQIEPLVNCSVII